MGIIINRSLPIVLKDLVQQLGIDTSTLTPERESQAQRNSEHVFFGGPCQHDRGFIIHNGDTRWESSTRLNDETVLTSSKDILVDIAHNKGPTNYLVALGYAGWSAGQLDDELSNNAWITSSPSESLLFNVLPEHRWHTAANAMGFDINLMSTQVGYA